MTLQIEDLGKLKYVATEKEIEQYFEDLGDEGTYIDRVMVPHHAVLNLFFSQLTQQKFETMSDLKEAIGAWPKFAQAILGDRLHHDWEKLDITQGEYINCGESPGGPFIIAAIRALSEESTQEAEA